MKRLERLYTNTVHLPITIFMEGLVPIDLPVTRGIDEIVLALKFASSLLNITGPSEESKVNKTQSRRVFKGAYC